MSTGTITIICAVITSSALSIVAQAIVDAAKRKRRNAETSDSHFVEIDRKLDEMKKHQDEQYLAILRLTIMSEEMPMAERLIAGKRYIDLNGNGDVKKFVHDLEAKCGRT